MAPGTKSILLTSLTAAGCTLSMFWGSAAYSFTTIAEVPPTGNGGTFNSYAGQSFTTQSSPTDWTNIQINFFNPQNNSNAPLAYGNLYLFSSPYTGTPSGLSSSSPIGVASASGNVWSFGPSVTLAQGTQYFAYTDTIIPSSGIRSIPSSTYAGGQSLFAPDASSPYLAPNPNNTNDSAFLVQATPVPAPLPLLGAAAAFGYSRKLRKRIKGSKVLPVASAID